MICHRGDKIWIRWVAVLAGLVLLAGLSGCVKPEALYNVTQPGETSKIQFSVLPYSTAPVSTTRQSGTTVSESGSHNAARDSGIATPSITYSGSYTLYSFLQPQAPAHDYDVGYNGESAGSDDDYGFGCGQHRSGRYDYSYGRNNSDDPDTPGPHHD
jgi:hypothetical protein